MEIIYRDDDANVYTCPHIFKQLHEKGFVQKQRLHTVAVLMKDLWQNHALFYYLNVAPYLKVELHGWEHKDYSKLSYDECYGDLKKSVEYWNTNATRMMGKPAQKITTFFAPWNHSSDNIKKACKDLGLLFCDVKEGSWNGDCIRSFHWWAAMGPWFDVEAM